MAPRRKPPRCRLFEERADPSRLGATHALSRRRERSAERELSDHVTSAWTSAATSVIPAANDDIRQECHLTGALDGDRDLTLMAPAGSCIASRLDLASVADVAAQSGGALVVNLIDLVFAEVAVAAS